MYLNTEKIDVGNELAHIMFAHDRIELGEFFSEGQGEDTYRLEDSIRSTDQEIPLLHFEKSGLTPLGSSQRFHACKESCGCILPAAAQVF